MLLSTLFQFEFPSINHKYTYIMKDCNKEASQDYEFLLLQHFFDFKKQIKMNNKSPHTRATHLTCSPKLLPIVKQNFQRLTMFSVKTVFFSAKMTKNGLTNFILIRTWPKLDHSS